MSSEKPFRIQVSDEKLKLLKAKLDLTVFPDELVDVGSELGAPLTDVKRLVARWKDGYDWRAAESKLNEMPQFTQDIEIEGHGTLNIHYVHQKSEVVDAIPLLFVHGWPGNFAEVRKILPLLTSSSPKHPSFHVVALSLPGFGWSEGVTTRGFKLSQHAELGNKLMSALGYNYYVTQGGDWGYYITRTMAVNYGHKSVKAWHTNYPYASPPNFTTAPLQFLKFIVTPWSENEKAGLERTETFRRYGTGYGKMHATKPQTVGYSLADSPVGLLAWIYEKLVGWTDAYPWDDDEVLTWISIYWFSRAGPASTLRIYYENMGGDVPPVGYATVPTGISMFPKELIYLPKIMTHTIGNVVSESVHEAGGHFAAYEQPELLVGDVRKMFAIGGPAFGVVPGKTGYA